MGNAIEFPINNYTPPKVVTRKKLLLPEKSTQPPDNLGKPHGARGIDVA